MKSVKHVDKYGIERWYEDVSLHRENGPAIKSIYDRERDVTIVYLDDSELWFLKRLHREDGPAILYKNGSCEYWLNNKSLSFEEWLVETTAEGRISYIFSGDE